MAYDIKNDRIALVAGIILALLLIWRHADQLALGGYLPDMALGGFLIESIIVLVVLVIFLFSWEPIANALEGWMIQLELSTRTIIFLVVLWFIFWLIHYVALGFEYPELY
jgi:hypothetical protein